MPHFYVDAAGQYYVADDPLEGLTEVPERPAPGMVWNGTAWSPDPLAYREKRAAAYPAIGDQLDALLKYLQTQAVPAGSPLAGIIAAWQAVKTEFPKPTP